MLRSLKHYWQLNTAVALGAAVGTAVLTGALMVGDSVRGSLRDLTLDRLGKIDHVLVADRFFREDLADDIASDKDFKNKFDGITPGILLTASATHAKSRRLATQINLLGVSEALLGFYYSPDSNRQAEWQQALSRQAGQPFPAIVISQTLQKELGAEPGDELLIAFEHQSEVPRETLLGSRKAEDVVKTSRFIITQIIPEDGIGRFSLRSHQTLPLNAFVATRSLQRVLDERKRVNCMFVAAKDGQLNDSARLLPNALKKAARLEDLGITCRVLSSLVAIESREIILPPAVVEAVEKLATRHKLPQQPVLAYLANTIRKDDRIVPYSTVAAVPLPVPPSFPALLLNDRKPVLELTDDEILLNEWAAADLQAQPGDELVMEYFTVGAREQLVTERQRFHLKSIVRMEQLGADRHLMPEFPGIHEADDMRAWDPPFPVDLNLIRQKDEDYWDSYRTTPKAFLSLAAGQRLWRSRFGELTSVRLAATPDIPILRLPSLISRELLTDMDLARLGMYFQPVKSQGLAAAAGATDFSGLFLAFSFFLIIAAALLVGILFRLSVEQRAKEMGLHLALGYPLKAVRRMLLSEGVIVAAVGGLLGIAGAVAYAALLMHGLRTWWSAAVGSTFLNLHVEPSSIALGYLAALAITVTTIWLSLRQLRKIPTPALLHGVTSIVQAKPPKIARVVALSTGVLAIITIAAAILINQSDSAILFFVSGTLLLISGLTGLSLWLRHHRRRQRLGVARRARLAIDYAAHNPGRSLLSVSLVSCACFTIVAVGSYYHDYGEEALAKDSGTGGFALLAQSDIPLHHDLNSENGRFELGITATTGSELTAARVYAMRALAGEDASCLNLYKPDRPTILGVSPEQLERGGFAFKATLNNRDNPWQLLEQQLAPGVIPAIGDENSVQWILHSGLGKELEVTNERGEIIKLRFVGLLQKSIFQSEVLISEKNFLEHFPTSASGYTRFLIEAPAGKAQAIAEELESQLSDYGFDVTSTLERLRSYQAVENTYLSVFQSLGGLGLLLGTIGLALLLIRNVIERSNELATLRAFGFRHRTLFALLLLENVFLISIGIAIGSIAALLAISPTLLTTSAPIPWLMLGLTLLLVLLIGTMASGLAAAGALRMPLLPALKSE